MSQISQKRFGKEWFIIHTNQSLSQPILFREPVEEDGKAIWGLIRGTQVLDLNSPYSYLMLCRYFSQTCVVAEIDNKIVGFVSAFCSPTEAEVLFVWQVAVEKSFYRRGLGLKMLEHLLAREACENVAYLEITVNPSNEPAYRLYHKLAEALQAPVEEFECFSAELFPLSEKGQHEAERMLRIGPCR